MKIKRKILSSLGIASIAAVGTIGYINSAEAAQLAPGRINFVAPEGLEFVNNALDFAPAVTTFDPGVLSQGGDFTVNFATDAFATLSPTFLGKQGIAVDLYAPSEAIDNIYSPPQGPGQGFLTGVEYDLIAIYSSFAATAGQVQTVGGEQGLPFLYFDLDGDNDFTDDAVYYVTDFVRTAIQDPLGGFNATLSFQGFFYSPSNLFDLTFSEVALLNGTTSIDPNLLPVLAGLPPATLTDADFTNLDGVITTVAAPVPEPGTIIGLMALGLGGLFTKKQANKQSLK